MLKTRGFTLIELMITVAIIGIVAALGYPSYTDYIRRGKLTEAISGLSDMRVKLEQYFQDNRNYDNACVAGSSAIAKATSNFTFSCTPTAGPPPGYTAFATGTGSMAGFHYSVDQSNNRVTMGLGPPELGWRGVGNGCWVIKKDGSC